MLAALTDVNVTEGSGIDGWVLAWKNSATKWEAKQLAAVAVSGAYGDLTGTPTVPTNSSFSLAGLSDVTVTEGSAINGYALLWNQTAGKWEAGALTSGATALTGLTDVNVTEGSGIDGWVLAWKNSATQWEALQLATVATTGAYGSLTGTPTIPTNATFAFSGLGDVSITSPAKGQIPVYNAGASKWENSSTADLPAYMVTGTVSGAVTLDRNNGETQILTLGGNVTGLTINNWGQSGTMSNSPSS